MGLLQNIGNAVSPYLPNWMGFLNSAETRSGVSNISKNLSRYISPVQLQRIKQDVLTWRSWVFEGENAWYPHRVKMQQGFLDTKLNGHVDACMDRRKKMTTGKSYRIVNKESRVINKQGTETITKPWFRNYMEYYLDSKAYGYSLIYLDDMVNDGFPNLSIIRRFNVSPDRLNVTQFVYSLSGANFLEEPFSDWHIWIPTKTEDGVSKCGWGYLYKVAFYEIVARNVLSQNLDATEQYGMPLRIGKTSKSQGPERDAFEQALAEMGSAGYMLMDAVGDEVELQESKSLGNAYKIYESLETRCEKKISKIILGHADAMDSTAGKLGGDQGGQESPAQLAMQDKCTDDMRDFTDFTNEVTIPKLRKLGLIFSDDDVFEFDDNEEQAENRRDEDDDNLVTAQVFQTIKNAGGKPDWNYFTQRTGITTTEAPQPMAAPGFGAKPGDEDDKSDKPDKAPAGGLPAKVKARLEKIYTRHQHR